MKDVQVNQFDDVGGFFAQAFAQSGGEVLAIRSGVGKKHAAAFFTDHESYYTAPDGVTSSSGFLPSKVLQTSEALFAFME